MSFSSDNSVVIHAHIDTCYDILSDPDSFEDFMKHDITTHVSIKSRDLVYIDDNLKISVVPEANGVTGVVEQNGTRERCPRIHFELTETVTYLGIAKEIPVVGYIAMSASRKIHIDHRSASDGLVVTDKVRRFKDISAALPSPSHDSTNRLLADEDSALDELVVDTEAVTLDPPSLDDKNSIFPSPALPASELEGSATEVEETLTGVTSWYLKYFTEIEARRSHKAFMERYSEYVTSRRTEQSSA